jgi:hypothetical protein
VRRVRVPARRLRSRLALLAEVGPRFSVPLNELLPVIYDRWTAPECRRRGYYAIALGRIAVGLVASARGIQKAGFQLYLTHVRTRFLGIERHTTIPTTSY